MNRIVAILGPRSIEFVVGLAGVIKSGFTFVFLDGGLPSQRIRAMLTAAHVDTLLVPHETRQSQTLCHDLNLTKISMEPDTKEANKGTVIHTAIYTVRGNIEYRGNDTHQRFETNIPAFLHFTSGSTGVPKCCLGSEYGLVNRCLWAISTLSFGFDEVCIARTSLNFIDSIPEILVPIIRGVTLCLASDEISSDVHELCMALDRECVTRISTAPVLLEMLLDVAEECRTSLGVENGKYPESGVQFLPSLRTVCVSGDNLTVRLARRFCEFFAECRLLNLYGTTEVVGDVTWCDASKYISQMQPHDSPNEASSQSDEHSASKMHVPIGSEIWNVQVEILDDALSSVHDGSAGEICIRGASISNVSSYFRVPGDASAIYDPSSRESRTESLHDRFFFSDHHHEWIFRTGDIGIRMHGNERNILCLGRKDRQIKIRGQRVEPAEIEAFIIQNTAVQRCTVVLVEDSAAAQEYVSNYTSHYFCPSTKRTLSENNTEYTKLAASPYVAIVQKQLTIYTSIWICIEYIT